GFWQGSLFAWISFGVRGDRAPAKTTRARAARGGIMSTSVENHSRGYGESPAIPTEGQTMSADKQEAESEVPADDGMPPDAQAAGEIVSKKEKSDEDALEEFVAQA